MKTNKVKNFYEKWYQEIYPKLAHNFYKQQYLYHRSLVIDKNKIFHYQLEKHKEDRNDQLQYLSERKYSTSFNCFHKNLCTILSHETDSIELQEKFKRIWFLINTQGYNLNSNEKINYESYLRTRHWRKIKSAMMLIKERKCEMCIEGLGIGNFNELHVHHKHYKNLGHEQYEDLLLLCELHHKAIHNHQ
ncbi:hypothetical protein [Crocosphaera chwakensis]|uniref:Uncharacterized protein n=1 Tax=Crocosphaera chwakensis CCY0110 TaxID=391612 RepID=A3IVA7_9CHRO|nr:hypothetical protein [Crocosphaera chwakensis]EAZ89576.1 hypothetical protein CY0110_08416 [Crocosphaera chwakensis CCY0110]